MSSVLVENADPHVYLVGRPPMMEYLGFVKQQTVEGPGLDEAALADAWRAANDHIRRLEADQAGLADAAEAAALPPGLEPMRDALLADSSVQRMYSLTPVDVALVDLDDLVVFQKFINLAYVEQLKAALPEEPSEADVFWFALPTDGRYNPQVQYGPIGPNAWGFVSPSTDLRVLDAKVLDPGDVTAQLPGAPAAVVALVVGYGSNLLSAVSIEGRLILANGSHRAYALRDRGHRHVPCLIRHVSRREELGVAGVPAVAAEPDLYLEGARPPMLRDYFDDQLRMIVHVPRKQRQVQVQFVTQQLDSF